MSNKSQATKLAAQQAKKIRKAVTDNLVELDEGSSQRANPGELNQKIGQIDSDLDSLRKALHSTNKGLQDSLTQLNDEDTDLHTKVSEAYRQLGELDTAYQSLTTKSTDISREIKTVSKRINEVNQKTGSDIGGLSADYRALAERIEELAAKSKQTTQELNKSIKANAKAMQELEQSLLSEIDDLAQASRSRDESLEQKTRDLAAGLARADGEIRASQARLLKMQAVDEALEKRAASLEASTAELTKKSRELSRSTTTLNQRTQQMSQAIDALQTTAEEHRGLIENLQQRAEKLAGGLYALIVQERRHFRTLSGALALMLLLFLGFLVYNHAGWQEQSAVNTGLQAGIRSVGGNLTQTGQQVAGLQQGLSQLRQQNLAGDAAVQQELTHISQQLVTIGDQVDSLDGRVTNLRPYRSFGNGSVIHGPEWLAAQTPGLYVIHLATLPDKQGLYQLAERYSHYLKDELAYLPVDVGGARRFALIYGGFASEQAARSALSAMPRHIERQRPSIQQMGTIQHYLAGLD